MAMIRTEERADVLAAFAAKAVLASSDHRAVPDWSDVVAEMAEESRRRADHRIALSPTLVAARPELPDALRTAGLDVVIPGPDDPASAVADVPVGMVRGELAVAETGSVLISEHSLEDRVVTMLCHRLIQVVHVDDIVSRLDDLAVWLTEHSGATAFVSLMTGPSRTADIERSLTIGVQGPQEVGVRVLTGPPGMAQPPPGGPR